MNYLGHLFLTGSNPGAIIGGLLGDFTRVPNCAVVKRYGKEIGNAVILHRKVDIFTDSHQDVASAVHLLFPGYRHYSRVIIDIFWDYFLTVNWDKYSRQPIDEFIENVYRIMRDLPEGLTTEFYAFAKRLVHYDGLRAYGAIEDLKIVFDRIQTRIKHQCTIRSAWKELNTHGDSLEKLFMSFFPDICNFVNDKTGW